MAANLTRVKGDNFVIIKAWANRYLAYASVIKPHVRNALCVGFQAAEHLHPVSDLLPGL